MQPQSLQQRPESMRVTDTELRVNQETDPRRPKSMVAEYAKEKKGNASKQFSYNKLVNERSKSLRSQQQLMKAAKSNNNNKQKPERPPLPRADQQQQEGLLIDLSPVEGSVIDSPASSAKRSNNNNSNAFCILDEPIEVPTEEDGDLDAFHDALEETPAETGPAFRCPPPYQQPPQYSNLFEASPQSSPQKPTNLSQNYSNSLPANELLQNLSRQMYASVNSMAKAPSHQRPDPIGASVSSSFSSNYSSVPPSSASLSNPLSMGLGESFAQLSVANGVDAGESSQSLGGGAVPKKAIDRNFIAELEKYVSYKDQSALQVNSVQALATKEVSPKKNFSANSQSEMMERIYGNSDAVDGNGGVPENATTALIQQMWQDSQQKSNNNITSTATSGQIYSNNAAAYQRPESVMQSNTHNFVAVSNRPVSMAQPSLLLASHNNQQHLYNSVYGSTGDNYYSTAGVQYEACPPVQGNSIYSNAQYTQQQPFAVYDEVAAEELLQPTRPAPTVPVLSAQQIQRRIQSNNYSDVSQIYADTASIYGDVSTSSGSIYGDVIENQKITAFCVEVGPEASVIDARQALMAKNWDHRLAVRHFKVDQLMKLGLGSRDVCEGALAKTGWSVEVAASILLEK